MASATIRRPGPDPTTVIALFEGAVTDTDYTTITSLGDEGIFRHPAAKEVGLYLKAVGDNLDLKLQGRLRVTERQADGTVNTVTGDWIDVGSALSVTAGGSNNARLQLSDKLGAANEFRLQMKGAGGTGAATCQAGIHIEG